jgi:hypothetical protein
MSLSYLYDWPFRWRWGSSLGATFSPSPAACPPSSSDNNNNDKKNNVWNKDVEIFHVYVIINRM